MKVGVRCEPVSMRRESRVAMSVDSTVVRQGATVSARHWRKRPVKMPPTRTRRRRLVQSQPEGYANIQPGVVRKFQKPHVRRPVPDLLLRIQQCIFLELINLVQHHNIRSAQLQIEQMPD